MLKKVKCEVSICECGRINICHEDEENHIKETRHRVQKRNWRVSNKELQRQVGIIILAKERGYVFK